MPPLYNAYEAKLLNVLHSKLCKENLFFFWCFFFSFVLRSHRAISLNQNQNLRNQNQYPVCGWANLRSRPAIPFNQNQYPVCGWANLRSRLAIPFNQDQNPVCGWANLRSRPVIPFNQNQYPVCGWANLRSHPAIPFNQNQNLVCSS